METMIVLITLMKLAAHMDHITANQQSINVTLASVYIRVGCVMEIMTVKTNLMNKDVVRILLNICFIRCSL